MNRSLITIGVFLSVIVLTNTIVSSAQQSYTEDFTSTIYKDMVNTSADWNTIDGELKLFSLPSFEGSLDTPGDAYGVVVEGDLAFVVEGNAGLQVIDISNPANPIPRGICDTPGAAYGVAVAGDHAFVADNTYGLQVIDISDPVHPTLISASATPSWARGVAVSGNFAYVADYYSGLQVINISDPTNPMLVGGIETPGPARGVAISGDLALVADSNAGLQVIDITDPTNPEIMVTYNTPGSAYGVAISGNLALVADTSSGLQMIDITDPTSITLIGNYDTPGSAQGITVSGNLACVADYTMGLQVISIADPKNPTLVGSIHPPGPTRGVAVWGDLALLAADDFGLQVIKIVDPVSPELVGNSAPQIAAESVVVAGDLAYVLDYDFGLRIFDIMDLANPTQVGISEYAAAHDIAVSGDHAYLAWGGFLVMDIKDPTDPQGLAYLGTVTGSIALAVSGNLAYVACGSMGLRVVDITDPSSPVLVGSFWGDSYFQDVTVAGDLVFVAGGSLGLLVFDVTDPTNPVQIGNYDTLGFAYGVTVSGNFAFIADYYDRGFLVIDITDPRNPFFVASNAALGGNANNIAVSGDFLFLSDEVLGLQVYDIVDPANPTLFGSYDISGSGRNVVVAGQHAFVVGLDAGLQIIKVFQSEFIGTRNVGQSLAVDEGSDVIIRACLSASQTSNVSWELSADNGVHWQTVAPDNNWAQLTSPGSDLIWRSTHAGSPGINPTVDQLSLKWANHSAKIHSITDIPNDQGRQVSLEWFRSGHDFMGDPFQIVEYAVYRKIEAELVDKAPDLQNTDLRDYSARVKEHAQIMLGADWHFVTTVPVRVDDYYAVVVPTLADSTVTDGQHFSTFMVSALTSTPGVFYDSPPDSGFSVDNLAPGVPTAITAAYQADSVILGWGDAEEEDFQYYRVFRGTAPGFTPSLDNLIAETTTSAWIDSTTSPWDYHYKITVLDFSGNESDAGAPSEVTDVLDLSVPTKITLLNAFPNPFNPQTTIAFDLPRQEAVKLAVYDVSGRLVDVLLDCDIVVQGRNEVLWRGRDLSGRVVSAGVYFYRLEAGSYSETKRMVLVK